MSRSLIASRHPFSEVGLHGVSLLGVGYVHSRDDVPRARLLHKLTQLVERGMLGIRNTVYANRPVLLAAHTGLGGSSFTGERPPRGPDKAIVGFFPIE